MNIKKNVPICEARNTHAQYGPLINSTFDIKLLIINWSSQNEL